MAGLVPAIHAKQLRNMRKAAAIDGVQLASGDFSAGPVELAGTSRSRQCFEKPRRAGVDGRDKPGHDVAGRGCVQGAFRRYPAEWPSGMVPYLPLMRRTRARRGSRGSNNRLMRARVVSREFLLLRSLYGGVATGSPLGAVPQVPK